jgi:hypothetical protein
MFIETRRQVIVRAPAERKRLPYLPKHWAPLERGSCSLRSAGAKALLVAAYAALRNLSMYIGFPALELVG